MNLSVVKKPFTVFLLVFIFFSACTKIVTTDIGSGLIPPVDSVDTKEIFLDIISKNVADTITKVATSDDHALGYVDDPLFGKTTASINVQLKPASFPFYFPGSKDGLSIDSVVMVLSYKGLWGDSLKPLAFRVFEISPYNSTDAELRPDTVYATNRILPRGNELTENKIAKYVYPTTLNDSIKPDPEFEQAANQLRITLDKSYGDKLLHDFDSTDAYKNDSIFNTRIKGYQIVPEQTTGNSLLRINLLDTNTKLAIYFKYLGDSGKKINAIRYFRCNSYNCGSTNYIQHNRTGKEVQSSLPPISSDKPNDSLIFIDANPGIYARLQIPGLDADTMKNKIIHRAEILMEQVPDLTYNSDTYLTPANLFITPFSNDSSRRFVLPNDVQLSSGYISNQAFFGCYPSTIKDSITGRYISRYSFDISRYVQGILTRHEKSYPLILYAPSVYDFVYITETSPISVFTGVISSTDNSYIPLNAPSSGRVRLGGAANSLHRMKLRIVYSDL